MTDHEPVRRARESSVRHQGDLVAEARALDGARHVQHLEIPLDHEGGAAQFRGADRGAEFRARHDVRLQTRQLQSRHTARRFASGVAHIPETLAFDTRPLQRTLHIVQRQLDGPRLV